MKLSGTELEIAASDKLSSEFFSSLTAILKEKTGERWTVSAVQSEGAPSFRERELAAQDAVKAAILDSPLVKAAREAFPQAELVSYSAPEPRSLAS